VRPEAIRAAARAGLDLRGSRTRSLADITDLPDVVVTVCDVAHEEVAPALAEGSTLLHWSIPDPSVDPRPRAFEDALARITSRVEVLAPRVHPPSRPRRSRR
jgi:protein-tyrosine-phosphatase